MEAGVCWTLTVASPEVVTALAMIEATPFPVAVTSPVAETPAMPVVDEDHLTAIVSIGCPN